MGGFINNHAQIIEYPF